jgi:site-specific recombinase XerD
MSLRNKSGKWEYRFWLNGTRVTAVTDLEATEPNRPKALKLQQQRRDAILKGEKVAKKQVKRGFIDATNEFLKFVKVQHENKPNTIKRVETSLASMRAFFGQKHVESIKPSDVNKYSLWRRSEHKVKPITLRHDLDNLSKFFKWARTMDLATDNPVRDVEKPSSEAERIHVLTHEEEVEYFHRCELLGYQDLADLGRIILDQGMRPEEVMSLPRTALDLVKGRVHVFSGKTKAAKRTLKLKPAARDILVRRYTEYADGKWLFPSPKKPGRHLVKLNNAHDKVIGKLPTRIGKKNGWKELEFVIYDLRHTMASRAAEAGMDLATLASVLGHSSLRMVMKYVHISQSHMDEQIMKLVEPERPPTLLDSTTHKESVQ